MPLEQQLIRAAGIHSTKSTGLPNYPRAGSFPSGASNEQTFVHISRKVAQQRPTARDGTRPDLGSPLWVYPVSPELIISISVSAPAQLGASPRKREKSISDLDYAASLPRLHSVARAHALQLVLQEGGGGGQFR